MILRFPALVRTIAIAGCWLASPVVAGAQTPAAYESTPHGRVLACFGEAYALVELVDVATQNLSLLTLEMQRPPAATRPALAAGLVLSGTQLDQRQSLDIAERLVECTEGAAHRAAPDAGAAYAALAVQEEIDIALAMAAGFTSDYQMIAARLMQYFGESNEPSARVAPIRGFARFGDEVRSALERSRLAIDRVIEHSRPRP